MKASWIFTLALGLSVSAGAQVTKDKDVCRADREKFCAGITRGDGKLMECMISHKEALSIECQMRGEEFKAAMRKAREACDGDIEKFCAKEKGKGKGAVIRCLRKNKVQLSEACTDQFSKRHRRSH